MNMNKLIDQLRKHEGVRSKVYLDSEGIQTIGVGRNLVDRGLSEVEINFLLINDIDECVGNLSRFAWYNKLSEVRQNVLVNMCFNMGMTRLFGFKNMIQALIDDDYNKAADEMLDSKWARQVGKRAGELANMMRTDKF